MKKLIVGSNWKVGAIRVVVFILLVLVLGGVSGCGLVNNAGDVLTHDLAEPLGGVTAAKFDFNTGTGNLTIDRLTGGEPLLAGGTLQYFENLGEPARTLVSFNNQATLTLKWNDNRAPCQGAIEWQIHLNPAVSSDIIARSGGGNVKLDLAGMAVTSVSAETGGGNMDVVLPEGAANLSVSAKSGAGNVVVRVPGGTAARIHAATGLGAVIVDPRFSKIDEKTYQSPDYDTAVNKAEITLSSGAGNVEVNSE